ncbi:MAG TPA: glycerol-3-phosphate acyltransferase, partial [Roseiflexaceae bacterium]|nr:glycerol-3-phosphate acyltransferase [Roseiflexaceae bacterium]
MPTSELLLIAALLAGAYLIGSIPFSYLVARARGVDLRKVGSGNIGGANVWRACGFGPFVVAVALDILKGYLPTLIGLRLFASNPIVVLLIGIAAILGHTFPIYLRFKG